MLAYAMNETGAMTPSLSFAHRFSLEATRPTASEVEALARLVPRRTQVFVTALSHADLRETITAAARLRQARLEPVVHIAARRLGSAAALHDLINGLRNEADVRQLLIIGGDVDAHGPFPEALSVIQKGRLREAGIEEIGIGAYPEGHPRIPAGRMEAALDAKIAIARAQGLAVHIVSQFCFSPNAVLGWLHRIRACGIGVPVRVGMAGPTAVPTLLRYAKRCGVAASLRGLMEGTAQGLLGQPGPQAILDGIAGAEGLGDVAPHYFSFGGVLETARFACDFAAGRHATDRAKG